MTWPWTRAVAILLVVIGVTAPGQTTATEQDRPRPIETHIGPLEFTHDFANGLPAETSVDKLESYKEFPPSQRPASFTIDQAMEKLKEGFAR